MELPDETSSTTDLGDIEWPRTIRRMHSSEFPHDSKKIGDAVCEREEHMGDRIVRTGHERASPNLDT